MRNIRAGQDFRKEVKKERSVDDVSSSGREER